MTSRRPLIAGNWKMNGLRAEARDLAGALAASINGVADAPFDMVICPPFTALADAHAAVSGSNVALGAQDCHAAEKGAHTGDISTQMLADSGCRYVIVGHSERRADHGESDATVKAKAEAVLAANMIAIVCVGETEAQRDAGQTMDVVGGQVAGSLPDGATAADTVIAYEPVWAIGTGRVATPDQAQEVHADIRARLTDQLGGDTAAAMRILYGGSMKPDNAAELLALADVDGGLIGGASLKAEDFWEIAEACL